MLYIIIAFLVILIGAFIGYKALRVLLTNSWFVAWFTGTFGLLLLGVSIFIGLLAYDIFTYRQITVNQKVATVHFEIIEAQYFDAIIADNEGKQQRFSLRGDQWQLDARTVRFQGLLASYNIQPGYRLDRLSGRYYDLQKESADKRVNYEVKTSFLKVDWWQFVFDHPKWFPVISAAYGSARFMPMKDGAIYEISLSKTGLNAKPMNDAANKAVAEFQP